jgi:predicted transcriptional regulator
MAQINHTKLKKHLKVLMDNNMIEYDAQARIFKTSDKGIDFLKFHREFEKTFSWHCYCNTYKVHETISGIKRK